MNLMATNEELNNAIETLKAECAAHKECYSCPLYSDCSTQPWGWSTIKNKEGVVRCEDCKFFERRWCLLHEATMYEKDFCSDGERKNGDSDGFD